jgi:plastocyanin domain-containing protein
MIQIIVDEGIYVPSVLKARQGIPLLLEFVRKDKSPCAQVVVFNTLDVSQELQLNKSSIIKLEALLPGSYPFSCQMGMYKGLLIIE